jgi:hypothetical protein
MRPRIAATWGISICALSGILGGAGVARANPRPLPFTYIYETLPAGESEIEQYGDFTPVRAYPADSATPVWYGATQFQTEYEYGITDRLELGLYFTFVPTSPSFTSTPTMPNGNGLKQRLRYRLAEAGQWPIDLALYGEVSENEREIELEGKLILQRRVGDLRIAANAWVERELYYSGGKEWVLNPTAGAVYEVSPSIQPGIEWWMRVEYPDESEPKAFARGPNHFLGPTALLEFGKIWWSSGVYFRLNDTGRPVAVGDNFGKIWVRTVVGVSL